MKSLGLVLSSLLFAAFGAVCLFHEYHSLALVGFLIAVGLAFPARLRTALGAVREALPLLDRRSSRTVAVPAHLERRGVDDGSPDSDRV